MRVSLIRSVDFLAALFLVMSPKELVRQLPDFRAVRFDVVR